MVLYDSVCSHTNLFDLRSYAQYVLVGVIFIFGIISLWGVVFNFLVSVLEFRNLIRSESYAWTILQGQGLII